MKASTSDFLVIGGGIVGLTTALALKRRYPDQSVTLLEKEAAPGRHASGRNSGVLHAGFYYTADSLKARFTRDGNRALTRYCTERRLPINGCGKLVVATDECEDAVLDVLAERGTANGVALEMVDAKAASSIEPRVRTWRRALWSPTTAAVDPVAVISSLGRDARLAGVQLETGEAYVARSGPNRVVATRRNWNFGYLVNTAGLYADRIAHDFGFGRHYRILPFKGIYLESSEPAGSLRTAIYPVPNLNHPFLGVHFTVSVNGRIKIGPTAIPALWREQYEGFSNFRIGEVLDIGYRATSLFVDAGFAFRRLAFEELRKYSRRYLVARAGRLASGVRVDHYLRWGKPGIRAQLIDTRSRRLEMDFVVEGDGTSLHVLNAVSPGFTCSIPFADYLCEQISANVQRLQRKAEFSGIEGATP